MIKHSICLGILTVILFGCSKKNTDVPAKYDQPDTQQIAPLKVVVQNAIKNHEDLGKPYPGFDGSTFYGKHMNQSIKEQQYTLLHLTALSGDMDATKILLKKMQVVDFNDIMGATPLHRAVQNGHIEIVKELIKNGANVEARDNVGRTPLFWAFSEDNTDETTLELIKILHEAGADINAKDKDGIQPLHRAVKRSRKIAEYLINNGAEIDSAGYLGNTPLYTATNGGNLEVIKLLLEKGANINSKNNLGFTPLKHAEKELYSEYTTPEKQKEIIKFLKSKGAIE